MSYLGELRINWRFLAAATIGLGSGHVFNMYIASLFSPALLKAFGWPPAQFALIGTTILASVVAMPVAGRLCDRFGVRRIAGVGIVVSPLVYVGFSLQRGSFTEFLLLSLVQSILVASTTTSMVYSRLIAQQFVTARGFALAIAACAPAAAAAIAAPLLSAFIDDHGWRAAYLALGAWVAFAGAAAWLLIPAGQGIAAEAVTRRSVREDYGAILASPTFRLLVVAEMLCHLTLTVQASQLKLVLLERGLDSTGASWLLSLYAGGIVVGRFLCGLALDRFPAHRVAAVVLGLPALGFLIFGTGVQTPWLLTAAVLLTGASVGADFDVTAYLVMRYFRVQIFSTVYSLLGVSLALAAAGGSLFLSAMLKAGGGFTAFFLVISLLTAIGSLLFLRLGRHTPAEPDAAH
jgi:MFS family permease